VDGRLYKLNGRRLANLLRTDLPLLALAILAHIRQQATVWRETTRPGYIRIFSEDRRIDVNVRVDDWAKIFPYLAAGVWDPQYAPVQEVGYLHPNVAYDYSSLQETDRVLYNRILDDLKLEFPKDYPTSPL